MRNKNGTSVARLHKEKPAWVKEGAVCRRLPCGRACRIVKTDDVKLKALVQDSGFATVWVNYVTLRDKWDSPGNT